MTGRRRATEPRRIRSGSRAATGESAQAERDDRETQEKMQSMSTLRALAPLRFMLLLLAIAAIAGCGFHLRGEESLKLPARLSPMHLSGISSDDPLRGELTATLREAGVTVTPSREAAQSFLVLSGRENRRRVLAVNAQGRAIEYEMVEAVTFELLDRERNVLLSEFPVSSENRYTDPAGDPLGKAGEQQLLRNSARRDTVQQIMVRLRYGTR
jgi:LPS-assembly lipoprotein